MKKIVLVAGTRPNFMKIAPVMTALTEVANEKKLSLKQVLVHTGQHYTPEMSSLFFDELGLPNPDIDLGISGGGHGEQTGKIMTAFEPILRDQNPDAVLVVGDVNSTLACALVAAKLNIPVIHVEAGLRSGDRKMPEEINRIVTDSVSDHLFTTERSAESNLRSEGIDPNKTHFVGNVMIDTLLKHKEKSLSLEVLKKYSLGPGDFVLVTLHRPSNVDDKNVLTEIVVALDRIATQLPVFFPVHPRTGQNLIRFELNEVLRQNTGIKLTPPLGYLEFIHSMSNAQCVLTDSGGIQEETTILGVPCLTVRENTERPATIEFGTNELVKPTTDEIVRAVLTLATSPTKAKSIFKTPELWDGQAAVRIARIILSNLT